MTERKWTPCAAQSGEYHAGYNQALQDTAAPELYEALEDALNAMDNREVPISYDAYSAFTKPMREALSKARGHK